MAKNPTTNTGNLFESIEASDDPAPNPHVRPIRRGLGAKKTISDLHFPEAIFAVKESTECRDLKELQDSPGFPSGAEQPGNQTAVCPFLIRWFLQTVWTGSHERRGSHIRTSKILTDILRYLYLAHEPVMGACMAECLFPIELGMRVPASLFDRFLTSHYGGQQTKKTTQRLKSNLMRLGVLERTPGEDDRLVALNPTKTSLLLLTHYIFASAEPRTIELRNLLANPFWKYLGLKGEDEVRAIFREADAAGCIGKYVVADQLEQVTTCLTLDAFLSKKVRL